MPGTLAIVGAGRVGRALGRALRERGWRIGAVVTRSRATAREAVRAIGGGTPFHTLTPRVLEADLVLISTPDDAVAPTAARLAALGGLWRGKVVLHSSGALSSAALRPLRRKGAAVGSFHPMQTFSGKRTPPLRGVICAMEGDAAAVRVARRIAKAIGGVPARVALADKVAYHASGSYAAFLILAMIEAGTRILTAVGFPRRQALRTLSRMARETIDNLEQHGPQAAWTGPLGRRDYQTLARHVRAMKRFPREYFEVYSAGARLTVQMLAPHDHKLQRKLRRILRGNQQS